MANRLLPPALRYVEEVVRRGSIQRTARELNVAASAINRHLLLLEAELGIPLFERLPRGMRPTAAGEAVAAMARRWRADIRRVCDSLQELQGANQGHVRIAVMDSHANGLLPPFVVHLADAHPAISLEIQVATTDEAAAALLAEQVDLIVAHNLPPGREMHAIMTETLPFGCVVAPGHALAGCGSVTLQQVADHPIALQSRSLAIRRYLDANHSWLFAQRTPPVVTNSLQLVKALARSGRYAAFTSELDAAAELLDGSLRFVRVRDPGAEPQSVTVAIGARRTSRTAQLVAQFVVEEVRQGLRRIRAAQV